MADASLGRLLVRLGLDKREFDRELVTAQRTVAQATRSLSATLGRIAVPVSFSLISRAFLRETIEAERVALRLGNALKATGRAISTASIDKFATEIQRSTTFTDEAAKSVVALLAQYKGISDQALPRVTKAVLDYAARTGTDAVEATRKFGAAFNAPTRGITQLAKGVFQVSGETKKLIKDLSDAGRSGEAFGVILGEVEKNTRGAAAEIRNTLGGSLIALKNVASDLLEQDALLGVREEIEKLIEIIQTPAFREAAAELGGVVADAFILLAKAAQLAGENVGKVKIVLGALVGAKFGGPIGALAGGLAALLVDVEMNADDLQGTIDRTQSSLADLANLQGSALPIAVESAKAQLEIARVALAAAEEANRQAEAMSDTRKLAALAVETVDPVMARRIMGSEDPEKVKELRGFVIALEGALEQMGVAGGKAFTVLGAGADDFSNKGGVASEKATQGFDRLQSILDDVRDKLRGLEVDEFTLSIEKAKREIEALDKVPLEQQKAAIREVTDGYNRLRQAAEEAAAISAGTEINLGIREDQVREIEETAKRAADAMQAPFIEASEGIQDALVGGVRSAWDEILGEADGFAGDLINVLKDTLSELAVLSLKGGFLQSVAGGGLFGGGGGAAPSVLGDSGLSREQVIEGLRSGVMEGAAEGSESGTRSGFSGLLSKLSGLVSGGGIGGGGGFNLGGLFGAGGAAGSASGIGAVLGLGMGVFNLLRGAGVNTASSLAVSSALASGFAGPVGALAGGLAGALVGGAGGAAGGAVTGSLAGATVAWPLLAVAQLASIYQGITSVVRFLETGTRPGMGQTPLEAGIEGAVAGEGIGGALGAWVGLIIGAASARNFPTTGFGFSTRAEMLPPGTPGAQSQLTSPFGVLGLDIASQRLGGASTDFLKAIQSFDEAVAERLTPEQIAAVSTRLQGGVLSSFNERNAEAISFGFDRIFAERVKAIVGGLGGNVGIFEAGQMGPGGVPPIEGSIAALNAFLTGLASFELSLRTLAGESIPQLEVELANLTSQFEEAKHSAETLGLDAEKLSEAFEIGKLKIATDFLGDLNQAILAFTDPTAAALAEQAIAQEKRLAEARIAETEGAIGAIVAAEKLGALERARIIEQAGKPIEDLIASLTGTTASPLGLATVLENAETAFAEIIAKVQGGDFSAVGDLTSAAQTLIDVSREAFGGGASFFERFDFIVATLQAVLAQLPQFASGGSFTVGGRSGTDAQLVSFWATRGEVISIQTAAQAARNVVSLNGYRMSRGLPAFATGGAFTVGASTPGAMREQGTQTDLELLRLTARGNSERAAGNYQIVQALYHLNEKVDALVREQERGNITAAVIAKKGAA